MSTQSAHAAKHYVPYAALLDRAHQSGLRRITTNLLQAPDESNVFVAIVTAQVETDQGLYDAIGEANPQNVSPSMTSHLIHMAETRAKSRALCDALNLADDDLECATGRAAKPAPLSDSVSPIADSLPKPVRTPGMPIAESPFQPDKVGPAQSTGNPQLAGTQHSDQIPRATPHQLATISRLSQLLGVEAEVDTEISTVAATARISELAQAFNDRKRG